MHDLNDALDELRAVIPYAHGPSVRKLSKIATLLLAKNYILMQARALDELRRLVGYMNHHTTPLQPPPRPSLAVRTPSSTGGGGGGASAVIGGPPGPSSSDVYSSCPTSHGYVNSAAAGDQEPGGDETELRHVSADHSSS